MGQVLFWLEATVTSVLFVALGLGVLSRIQRRGRRWTLRIVWGFLTLLPWLVAIGAFAAVEVWAGGALIPLISASVSGGVFLVTVVVVIKRARKPSALANIPVAATWRLGRLVLAWAAALLLACMTFWNLDLAVRQEMAALRVEAGAIALSVSPPQIPDSQNAAVLYRQAWDFLDSQKGTDGKWNQAVAEWLLPSKGDFNPPGPPVPFEPPGSPVPFERKAWLAPSKVDFNPEDEQMLAFLRKQGPVIGLLHEAARRPGFNLGIEYNPPSIELIFPSLRVIRDLSRLLCLSSRVNAHQGRMAEAMKDMSAALALADHCTADPSLFASLVSFAAEDQAAGTFQYILDQGALTSDSVNAMHLDSSLSFNAALHRSMRLETAFGMSIFTMLDPSAAVRVPGTTELRDYIMSDAADPYRVFLWRNDVRAYLRWMQRYETLSAQPYYQNVEEWRKPPQEVGGKRMGGPLATALVPSFSRSGEYAAKADAQHRLMMLGLAMWRYRLAEGAFPDDLGRLVPKYLLTVPADPFMGNSMKMAQIDGQTVIYSVGPDLKDDSGKPLDQKTKLGDISLKLGK